MPSPSGQPDVSVLTPSHRYGRFIADSIESVILQHGLDVQHVIQDAASDDETTEVLASFGDRVEWTSERDIGQSDGLNKALAKAKGRWVAWLNADEYYLPDGLRKLVEEGERQGADVVYGDSVVVDRDGRILDLRPQHSFSPLLLRLYGPYIASASVIIRRSMLGVDPWNSSLKVVMDWDLFLGLASKGAAFRYVKYPVGAFRQHEDQVSAQPRTREARGVREQYEIPTARWPHKGWAALHRIRKLVEGSYARQLRARQFRGRDLRWFEDGEGVETFKHLLDRCYGHRRGPGGQE
jgi:glycosyltransferase involved in cell wall biosynthesis